MNDSMNLDDNRRKAPDSFWADVMSIQLWKT